MHLPTEPKPHPQFPQLSPHFPSGAEISLFREGLAILPDQNGGGLYTGTEGGLTCLWSLEDVREGEKWRWGRKEEGKETWWGAAQVTLGALASWSLAEKATPNCKGCTPFIFWSFSLKSVQEAFLTFSGEGS